jgi:hypothetical protein
LESLTLAILRKAEFGFFGVAVLTDVHTPRFCGLERSVWRPFLELNPLSNAGAVDFLRTDFLSILTSWLNVGILYTSLDLEPGFHLRSGISANMPSCRNGLAWLRDFHFSRFLIPHTHDYCQK